MRLTIFCTAFKSLTSYNHFTPSHLQSSKQSISLASFIAGEFRLHCHSFNGIFVVVVVAVVVVVVVSFVFFFFFFILITNDCILKDNKIMVVTAIKPEISTK